MAADRFEVAPQSPEVGDRAEIDGLSPTPADIVEAEYAPGWPGIPGRWTSSAKSGVGTALSALSKVWFTLSHGILNEIYYPRIDQACTRDLGLIVTDGASFFSEKKRHARSVAHMVEEGVPAYVLVNTCGSGRYRIEKTVLADPRRDVILQQIRFVPLKGAPSPTTASTFCWRPIWATAVQATPAGPATTKALRCSSPRATATRWPLPAPPHGSPARSDSSASPTAGRISPGTDG